LCSVATSANDSPPKSKTKNYGGFSQAICPSDNSKALKKWATAIIRLIQYHKVIHTDPANAK